MLTRYIGRAMDHAKFEELDDGGWYGEIEGFDGVWSHAPSEEESRQQLEEVLEEWVLFRVSRQLELPVVDGVSLVIKKAV